MPNLRSQRAQDGGFSGVVLIDVGGEIVAEGMGMADRQAELPNMPSTVFDIGSLTKQFTAAAILRLEMEGLLSVDDTLGEHLDGLPAEKAAITLHQLLTHTAGLPDGLGDDYEPVGREAYLELVAGTSLAREPGSGYEYSNVGYSVLAAVIETVTGGSYEQYLHDALFESAGMTATGYVLPHFDDHVVAVGYSGDEGVGRPNELGWDDDGPYWHLRGNGGSCRHRRTCTAGTSRSSALTFSTLKPRRTCTPATPAKVPTQTPTTATAGRSSPLGTTLVTHNGGNGIFFTDFLRFIEEDVTIFLATNAVRDSDESAAYALAEAILS